MRLTKTVLESGDDHLISPRLVLPSFVRLQPSAVTLNIEDRHGGADSQGSKPEPAPPTIQTSQIADALGVDDPRFGVAGAGELVNQSCRSLLGRHVRHIRREAGSYRCSVKRSNDSRHTVLGHGLKPTSRTSRAGLMHGAGPKCPPRGCRALPAAVHTGYTTGPETTVDSQRNQRGSERETAIFGSIRRLKTPLDGSPEAVAQVRILPGALSKTAGQRPFSDQNPIRLSRSNGFRYTLGTQDLREVRFNGHSGSCDYQSQDGFNPCASVVAFKILRCCGAPLGRVRGA
jgi:hypothetical protein